MKKILIISYYWPPCGGIGVLRCLKISKYLREFGWEPVVFTAEDAHYPSIDHSNDKDIPEGITILKQKIWEPYHIYKFITGQKKDANVNNVFYVKDTKMSFFHKLSVWIRSNFFIPDARALWIRPSVKNLLKYLEENPVDAIFSDGPPHSNTRIATLIKQKTGIPWLADFQDPWTQVDYYQLLRLTKRGDRKHRRMEFQAFTAADKTTIVSPTWKGDLELLGAKNVSVIPWGYDPEDFENRHTVVDEKFTITHLGIMGYDRNPEVLFQVMSELKKELPDFEKNVELKLVGQVDFSVREAYQKAGIENNVNLVGSVSRKEALNMTCSSNVLLLLLNQQSNAKGRIPGKLFEYLAAQRPILVMGPEDSDVAGIVAESTSGVTVEYFDHINIKKHLTHYYQQYLEGEIQKPLTGDITPYSIKKLTGKIAGYLDEISRK
jgi:glycosyltransferase involved in cell wall biosynthesis